MVDDRDANISGHYTHGGLLGTIEAALDAVGKSSGTVSVDDLAPVDEFHIGGRQASETFLDQMGLDSTQHLLDIGCGLGGGARFAATRYRARITGIDLTHEFVETGNILCGWVGLADHITLHQGSALAMPFEASTFDGAYMMHVGMNIEDKAGLFAEVHRILRPGAVFGIYDVMRTGDGEIAFPVPWASDATTSFVVNPLHYKNALQSSGFAIESERNRRDFALDFFQQMQARMATSGGPLPLGLHLLMGDTRLAKMANMVANIAESRIAPVELIARKAA